MKTPLALHNLWHQGAKTAVSVAGVAFALLLVFMQLGFMGAVSHTATNVLKSLKFDILIRGCDYLHLYEPAQLDRKWLSIAESTDGVTASYPFWITIHNWRTLPNHSEPQDDSFESQYLPIAIMAYEPSYCVFNVSEIESQTDLLSAEDSILIDDSTQKDYGPWDGEAFTKQFDIGRDTEIGWRQFKVRGLFKLGTGLAANGAVITSHRGFARVSPWDVRSSMSMGLIQVADASEDSVQEVAHRLRARAALSTSATQAADSMQASFLASLSQWLGGPSSDSAQGVIDVLTRQEALDREEFRWLWQTPIGLIFQLGVLLSLLVGAAIVYMVLSTDVANRLPEYATLLAMGYSRMYLASIVMTQAIILCGLGFVASWGVAEVLYRVTYSVSSIPLSMTGGRAVLVALLGILMCCTSGLLALRKLWKAEPANLF